ncbi:hypothetical protein SAMN05421504_103825 [Amycolatopsis xylanica]|uniref:Tryptophan-associated transmembrane protein (Trp_oprn_chp) n=1 Tax=Amycolatopsis xylanica TaxID=589385 RepID=A0A1H3EHH9_9PSEU|nr:hypothetical protein [Amycolatopsis xylanica]SDX78151.1 hypothetical protein SAMN05421504_103825 [Amycolatopsis xylanica]
MTYQQYPGQPYPGPQYPGQQYPGQQYPGQQPPPSAPSGGTAITAAVLAILGGLVHLVGAIAGAVNLGAFANVMSIIISVGVNPILAGLLIGGGIMIFLRKPAGRINVIIGAALAIVVYATAIGFGAVGVYAHGIMPAAFVMLLAALPAVATVVLASLNATARWLAPRPVGPPPPYGVPGYQLQQPPHYPENPRPW